jgi:hypothetical protein
VELYLLYQHVSDVRGNNFTYTECSLSSDLWKNVVVVVVIEPAISSITHYRRLSVVFGSYPNESLNGPRFQDNEDAH